MKFFIREPLAVFWLAVFFVSADRLLKILAQNYSLSFEIIRGLKFNLTPNFNIAFSFPLGGFGLNLLIVLIIAGLLFYFFSLINPVRNFKGLSNQVEVKLSGDSTAAELQNVISNGVKKTAWSKAVFLSAIILGAGSNLFDRLKYGYVIDYLNLKYFTAFNLADILIVGGITGFIWLSIDKRKK